MWQAMPKLPEVQAAMTRYFASQASRAGLGLELLPGVQQLLEHLQVGSVNSSSSSIHSSTDPAAGLAAAAVAQASATAQQQKATMSVCDCAMDTRLWACQYCS